MYVFLCVCTYVFLLFAFERNKMFSYALVLEQLENVTEKMSIEKMENVT